jgi:L-alanine-DL-glutamate epimerase-like enolase superfamily enzyme
MASRNAVFLLRTERAAVGEDGIWAIKLKLGEISVAGFDKERGRAVLRECLNRVPRSVEFLILSWSRWKRQTAVLKT